MRMTLHYSPVVANAEVIQYRGGFDCTTATADVVRSQAEVVSGWWAIRSDSAKRLRPETFRRWVLELFQGCWLKAG
jgi:hypothetical protein